MSDADETVFYIWQCGLNIHVKILDLNGTFQLKFRIQRVCIDFLFSGRDYCFQKLGDSLKLSVNLSEKGESLLDLILQSDVLELLLSEHLFGFLASPDEVRHHNLSRPIREVLVNFHVLVLRQLYSELVTESLELGESHLTIVDTELGDLVLSDLDTIDVVGGHEEERVPGQVVDNEFQIIVIALMSVLHRIPDWRLVVVLFGQLPFFIHICSSDELNTEVVAKDLGCGNLEGHGLFHSFEVLLVPIHDDVLLTSVVLMGELLAKGLNAGLHEGLLGIDVKHAVSLVCKLNNLVSLLGELFEHLEVRVGDTDTSTDGDSLH